MRESLTDGFAAHVKPTPKKIDRHFDTNPKSPRGFMVRVTPAGARTWALRYRLKESGREREISIGDVSSWPISEARKRAHELRREVDTGGDPLQRLADKRAEPVVAELAQRFIEESLPSRASSTQAEYKAMFRDWVLPAIGKKKVAAVDREDIERLHRKITEVGKSRRANAIKSLCSTLFTQAIVWKMCKDNPAQHIKGNPENPHERFLSGEELDRLMDVLERRRERRPDSVDAITLAVLTGARRGEILSMRWGDVDIDGALWTKPHHLTKQRKVHHLTLSPEAVAVLRRRQAERDGKVVRLRGDEVFRGAGSKTHCNTLERDWREIRAEARLTDCRFHDLRHSVASWLIAAGLSLPVVGSVLGHSKAQTTQRYSHLSRKAQQEAVDIVGALVGGGKSAK